MNKQTSLRTNGSLLERAAELYDFRNSLGQAAAPSAEPAATEVPAPADAAEILDLTVRADEPEAQAVVEETPPPKEVKPAKQSVQRPNRTVAVDRAKLENGGFILPNAPAGTTAEEFRIIKRQLLARVGRSTDARSVLVASSQPGEGKSFCALNLALSIAGEKDTEVLLIDGDFAKPQLPELLGIERGAGFIDALTDPSVDPNELVLQTDIDGLCVLTAGHAVNNVPELLASARMDQVLASLIAGRPNRIVIFDSPPTLLASHATVLAAHVGHVLMVVRADRTTEADLREAVSLLSACENINLVLNGASLVTTGRRFGTYYGYGG